MLLTTTAERTTTTSVSVSKRLESTWARTTNWDDPSAVGVPERRPVAESVTPAGGLPETTDHCAVVKGVPVRGFVFVTCIAVS